MTFTGNFNSYTNRLVSCSLSRLEFRSERIAAFSRWQLIRTRDFYLPLARTRGFDSGP